MTAVKGAKKIGQISKVSDLAEGEEAYPEHGYIYGIRHIDASEELPLLVLKVVRRGDRIYAVLDGGEEKCIASDDPLVDPNWVLCPQFKNPERQVTMTAIRRL